ncbi:MAG: hypothetical protein CSB06_00375 [Bacteroidia bacterium]|nr:MAG: hypothetical protein CSB06_00375 [Bacteroidia bacterium]
MEALRNIYKVENNRIIIDLPQSFNHKEVEVIVMPFFKYQIEKKDKQQNKQKQIESLLSVSVWKDDDIQQIYDSQNVINKWSIEEF